jgi:hypothetical protein
MTAQASRLRQSLLASLPRLSRQSLGRILHRNRWRRVRKAETPAQSLDLAPDFFEAKRRNAAALRPVGNASVDVSTRFTMVSRVQSKADPKARGRK